MFGALDIFECFWSVSDAFVKRNTGPRDQILPVSINWPTNYNFALFSKLPTNYTKISEKIQKTYVNASRSGAFWYVKCIFSEIFV